MSINANLAREINNTSQNIRKIYAEFNGNIFNNKFYINLDYLIESSVKVNFKHNWLYNPHKFCLDQYGVFELYPIILLVNNVKSIFEFKPDKLDNVVISPSYNSIYKVLSL